MPRPFEPFFHGQEYTPVLRIETFEKRSILFKVKEGENFNHRNTLKYFED